MSERETFTVRVTVSPASDFFETATHEERMKELAKIMEVMFDGANVIPEFEVLS